MSIQRITEAMSDRAMSMHARRADGRPDPLQPWERWIAHFGYLAEGVIYLLIGTFGLLAAVEFSEHPNGSRGVLDRLGSTTAGKFLVALLALGLAAFVLWQLLVAIRDPEHRSERHTWQRRLARLRHLLNGALYSALVGEAIWSVLGLAAGDSERRSQVLWTARAMRLPAGRLAVGIVGVGIAIFGAWQLFRAVTADKDKRVDLSRTRFKHLINALGVYGLTARAVLFGLIGVLLVVAAWHAQPRESRGIAGVLDALRRQHDGSWLLGVEASGLICFGLFQMAKERYRKLRDS